MEGGERLVKIHGGIHRMAMEEKWFRRKVLGASAEEEVSPNSLSF